MLSAFGVVFGTTVKSVQRKAAGVIAKEAQLITAKAQFKDYKDQAIADRMATIRMAQEDIEAIKAI